jgi:hypothetical protein
MCNFYPAVIANTVSRDGSAWPIDGTFGTDEHPVRYKRCGFVSRMLYFAGALLAAIVAWQMWRWWEYRLDVSPVSDRWLAEQRNAHEQD